MNSNTIIQIQIQDKKKMIYQVDNTIVRIWHGEHTTFRLLFDGFKDILGKILQLLIINIDLES